MSEFYGRYIFDFLKKLSNFFQSCPTIMHFYQQCMQVSVTSLSTLGSVSLFNFSHFKNCVMISHCGLNCISLITNNDEHLFVHLFDICMSFILVK